MAQPQGWTHSGGRTFNVDADFADFITAKQDGLLRYGTMLTGGDHEAAADLTQDTFLLLGRRWKHVREVEHHDAYARRTMTRLWWRRSKKARHEIPHADPADRVFNDPSPVWESGVWSALQQLPPRQRAVIVLRYFEDLSEVEIADALSCRPGTVKSQASRGIATLRRLLEGADTTSSRNSASLGERNERG